MHLGWSIQGRHERFPPLPVQLEAMPISQMAAPRLAPAPEHR